MLGCLLTMIVIAIVNIMIAKNLHKIYKPRCMKLSSFVRLA